MSEENKPDEAIVSVRLPRGMREKVDAITAGSFSTMSEYIRDLIRRDIDRRTPEIAKEEGTAA